MRLLLAAFASSLLSLPAIAGADTISLRVTGGELGVSFGSEPFQVDDAVESDDFDVQGRALLRSGSGGLNLSDGEDSNYVYGPGLLTLTLEGRDDDGNTFAGTFTVPTRSFDFWVCEGCDDLFGGGLADDFAIELGSGLFDRQLARLFGVNRRTTGGFIDFSLEAIDGDPGDASRTGFDNRGYAELEIYTSEVPEPALLSLAAIAAAASMVRRRRASRR